MKLSLNSFLQDGGFSYKCDEPLSKHTTIKIGGVADFFIDVNSLVELSRLLHYFTNNEVPYKVIGNGSNLLFSDVGFRGVVLKLTGDCFKKITHQDHTLNAGGAVCIGEVLDYCQKNELGGLEFLAGIPATLGGSLVMNAGGKNQIGDFLISLDVVDESGFVKKIMKEELDFGYRKSGIKKCVVVGCSLSVNPSETNTIKQLIRETLDYKKTHQDLSHPSAGCVFKNPMPTKSVGMMIDKLGLKGTSIGGAMVSRIHGNFIINTSHATSMDVEKLIDVVREKVYTAYNVDLELEIELIGRRGLANEKRKDMHIARR